jgi:hypothetical protein
MPRAGSPVRRHAKLQGEIMARRSAKTAAPELGEPYQLSSVDKADSPMADDGGQWCRYTITQGKNIITGYKKGSRTAVTRAAKVIVADLNERRTGRRGRVHLTSSKSG